MTGSKTGHLAGPRKPSTMKRMALTALLATAWTAQPVQAQNKNNCLLPEAFIPYFGPALDAVSAIIHSRVVQGLAAIGMGPIPSLNINDFLNVEEQVFHPLFGTEEERSDWIHEINATAVNVKQQLKSNLNRVVGLNPPQLNIKCDIEETDDLEIGELPYRFAMKFGLKGSLLQTDLDLASLSPSIAVLPEDTFDPLSFTVDTMTADYELKLPITLDAKRRKFMVGEITFDFEAAFSASVLQSLPVTETVSQNFGGVLNMNLNFAFSSVTDWTYTAAYEASLTAESSVGLEVAELGLLASDNDVFDDVARELYMFDLQIHTY